ncbi:hypothetical protein D9M71_544760 [compost metagenome]
MTFAPELFQFFIDKAAEVAGERHQCMGASAVIIQAQRPRHGVGAQQLRLAAAQYLAFGVGRQVGGVTDTDGYLTGCQQPRHQDVVDPTYHQHNPRRFGTQALEQHWQQGELDVVRKADAEHGGTCGRIELGRTADRGGNRIQCRGEQGEDLDRPGGRFHAAAGTHKQGVIEQAAQARERRTDGWLAEEQFFRSTGHAAFVHQCFENDQQVQVDTTQVITIHLESWQSQQT